jgi:hypothetical protein
MASRHNALDLQRTLFNLQVKGFLVAVDWQVLENILFREGLERPVFARRYRRR